MLSSEASAEPGRWNTDRAPYQRGILDAANDPRIDTVVVMSSAQVGKTELLLNLIGYYMDFDPSPILLLQPTLQMAEAFSKDRLAPMLRDTPALKGKVKDPRARDSGNTLLHKSFPGGHITMAGANSPASLASRPIRILLADEVDRYPLSAGTEGDPLSLGAKRTATFWNRKKIYVSTPTVKNASRIEMAYEDSDKRRYYVPCPHCNEHQVLLWKNVRWPEGKPGGAVYVCEHCGSEITEASKLWMLRRGEWRGETDNSHIAGFHISELYSPWRTWAQVAEDFLQAKQSKETLKTWVNTSLGETFEEQTEGVNAETVTRLREKYDHEIPEGVTCLTFGADVQADRIEMEIVGWSDTEESWSIDYKILPGDTTQRQVWDDLAEEINRQYHKPDGAPISIARGLVDSGYNTQFVYDFVKRVRSNHVESCKGLSGFGLPVIEDQRKRMRRRKSGTIDPQRIGVDGAKLIIYSYLDIKEPGPGYCHFPEHYDDEYFSQLTAEGLRTRFVRGFAVKEWVKNRPRNEALDCRVYAYAAFKLIPDHQKAKSVPLSTRRPNSDHVKDKGNTRRKREGNFLAGFR
jgi:phage terminase large subunit GpA-like protein